MARSGASIALAICGPSDVVDVRISDDVSRQWAQDAIVAFECIEQHFDSLIRSNVAESRALAAQRDVLLPGLVSGEVGVGGIDVE